MTGTILNNSSDSSSSLLAPHRLPNPPLASDTPAPGLESEARVEPAAAPPAAAKPPQRTCVVLLDGFGTDYFEQSPMPTLKSWAKQGFFKRIQGVMPSVTNTNITGVCCGVHADGHGITGNSYWDADGGREQFMSDGNLLTAATLFQRAARFGVRPALLSAKQKTIPLLGRGTALAVGAQQPPPELVRKLGPPPDVYSADVNRRPWTSSRTNPRSG